MQNQLFADLPTADRQQYLSDNCDRLEEVDYFKPFHEDGEWHDVTGILNGKKKVSA